MRGCASCPCSYPGCIEDPSKLIDTIHAAGMRAGVALKPGTPASAAFPYADKADQILVMTVEPGFGGQSFMMDCVPKIKELREQFPNLDIQVDGGLDLKTIDEAAGAGANVIVAGTSIFSSEDVGKMIQALREPVDAYIATSTARK